MRNSFTMQVLLELVAEGFISGLEQAARGTDEFGDSLKGQKPPADSAASSISNLKTQLFGLAAAYLSISTAKEFLSDVVRTVGATQQLNTRIRGLTDSTTAYNETLNYLSTTANELNADINTFSQSYTKLLTLQQAGLLTTQEARNITEGYANAAAKSGASNEQLSQSLYGLTQGLSAGTLRAEELNQITEALPGLMQQLDVAVGGTAGTFRRMVNDGQVSSEMLKQVMQTALQSYAGAAAATADNIIPTFTRVKNSYENFKNALENPVAAFVIPVLQEANRIINDFTAYAKANEQALIEMAQNAAVVFVQLMQAAADLAVWLFELAQGIINFVANNQNLVVAILAVYAAFVVLKQVMIAVVLIKIGLMLNQFLGITAGVIALTTALKAALLAATGASTVFAGLAIAIKAVAMAALGFLATPLGAVLLGLAAGYIALSAAIDSSRNSLEESHAATQKTVDALKFFRDSIDELKNMGPVGEGVVQEIERIRAAMFAGRISEADARAQVEGYMNAVRERIEEEKNLETQITTKKQQLAQQVTQYKIQQLEAQAKANRDRIKEAERLEQQYTDKAKQLKQELEDFNLSFEDRLRKKKRESMSEDAQEADKLLEIYDKIQQARLAAEMGDHEKASQLSEQAVALAENLGDVHGAVSRLAESSNEVERKLAENVQNKMQDFGINLRNMTNETVNWTGSQLETVNQKLSDSNDISIALMEKTADAFRSSKRNEIDAAEQSALAQKQKINRLKAQNEGLLKQMEELGKPKKMIVTADIQQAQAEIRKLEQQLERLKNTRINVGSNVEYRSAGGIIGHFSGGTILPGYGGGDRRMAMLEDGEGILNKDSTRRFRDLFLLMNYKPDDAAQLLAPVLKAPRFNMGGIMSFLPDIQGVPAFSTGGIMQTANSGSASNSGNNMQVFRLEIGSKGRSEGVTLMGEEAELARLNSMLKRASS